jgi:hypothetical protein
MFSKDLEIMSFKLQLSWILKASTVFTSQEVSWEAEAAEICDIIACANPTCFKHFVHQ